MKPTLDSIFQSVQRPGTFATGGEISSFLLNLQVDNIGRIGLLLCHVQVNELKGKCEQAPYGCREETIVDMNVRNVLELDASKVKIGERMKHEVTSLIPSLKTELGCDGLPFQHCPTSWCCMRGVDSSSLIVTQRRFRNVCDSSNSITCRTHRRGAGCAAHREEKVFDLAADSASKILYARFCMQHFLLTAGMSYVP